MKRIVIVLPVHEGTDIFHVHEAIVDEGVLREFNADPDEVSVFETEAAAFADYIESGRQFADVTGGRFE